MLLAARSKRRLRSALSGPMPLAVSLALVLIVFIALPLFLVVLYSLTSAPGIGLGDGGWSFSNFRRVLFESDVYRTVIVRSIVIGVQATFLTLLLAFLPAYYIATSSPKAQRILILLVIIPFWTPYIIRIFSWMQILSENGALNWVLREMGLADSPSTILYTNPAVLIGLVYSGIPFMLLPIYASISGIDTRLYEAASNLGAPTRSAFMHITVPLSLPGILAGSILTFILAAGSYLAPVILGGPDDILISQLVYDRFLQTLDWPLGSAVSVVYLLVVGSVIALLWWIVTRGAVFRVNQSKGRS